MPVLEGFDFAGFWDQSRFAMKEYVDESLTDELLARVQAKLGYALPRSYVGLCRNQNGGAPRNTCHETPGPTSWADDHVAITNIKAIGFRNRWSLCGDLGHFHRLDGWDYPPIGVYFGDCPSAGHDALCLDYRAVGADGEPCVVHVDQDFDFRITPVADSFEAFVRGLKSEDSFDLDWTPEP